MSNWDIDRTRLLHYLLEGFVILLALLNFTLIKHQKYAIGFLSLYLIGGILYWVFIKFKKDITLGSLVIFSPVVILIGIYILNVPIFFTIVYVAYIVWRVLAHIQEIDYRNEILLFSISLLIGLFEFIRFEDAAGSKYVLGILILQILLTIFIKLNRVYIEMKQQGDRSAKKFATWGFGSTGALMVIGVLFLFIFPLIQSTIFFIFRLIVSLLSFVIVPLSWLLEYFNITIDKGTMDKFTRNYDDLKQEEIKPDQITDGSIDFTIFYIIGGIIAVILLAIFFMKKLDLKPYLNQVFSSNSKVVADGDFNSSITGRRQYSAPTNDIRKRFYTFENLMVKYHLQRKTHESVLEWLERIELNNVDVEDVKSLYEKVRYGELNLSQDEKTKYFKLMDDLTTIAKERYKANKKAGKIEKNSKSDNNVAKMIKQNKERNMQGPERPNY